jgi:Domain of unknown function (DUF4352)
MRHFHYTLAVAALGCMLTGCTPTAPKIVTYEMGRRVSVGHLVYTVFETQWLTQLGTGADVRLPEHRFFLVRLSVVNGGSEQLAMPNLTLEDDQGTTYDELPNGDGVSQWVGYLRQARPAESIDGHIVFDAPPKHYKLRVYDETGDHSALIDIPLNFNSEAPSAPMPVAAPPAAAPQSGPPAAPRKK